MSSEKDPAANRKAALEQLRFKKIRKQETISLGHSVLSSSSSIESRTTYHSPPAQSRDASTTSRYFPATPMSPGNVLVPDSSPLLQSRSVPTHPFPWQAEAGDGIPGLIHSDSAAQPFVPTYEDPLSASSGFITNNNGSHAYPTRISGSSINKVSEGEHTRDVVQPPNHIHSGNSFKGDPIDFLSAPDSPGVQRLGQRRRLNGSASLSEDEVAGPSTSRIVRGTRSPPPSNGSEPSQSEEETRFTRFKLTQPQHPANVIRAAWEQAGGDVPKASDLLNDPAWKPSLSGTSNRAASSTSEVGRVKEIDDARLAQRVAIREKGKQSMIYKTRTHLDGKPPSSKPASVSSKATADATSSSRTSGSPIVGEPRVKRLKRRVVESESELESDHSGGLSSRVKRIKADTNEARALQYFNSTGREGLQELTGCTSQQADKIVELRPFTSVEDLKAKLGQGKKKAGPAGISSRMFEDCTAIFEGYGRVDRILEDCEQIGAELKAEIASWTKGAHRKAGSVAGTPSSRGSPFGGDSATDGALSLHTQATLVDHKPSYYLTSQPSLLSSDVQLKDYQMVGVNWLNLLYRRKLSCILADEMGLGKTIQVISFLAHLKEQGNTGPHLVVVPSSTLENWCREFERFAPEITFSTYYAGKEDRPRLRQELLDTQRSVTGDGWEVLITTYNLAQGDDKDRKFFRRIEWDACIFDEGHVLKNFQSQRYQTLLRYESRWRLLLTGTPLQNNLQELVSLMNFILPQQFMGNLDSLRAVFKTKGDSKVTLLAQERVSRAKKMMTPFVLRRRKDQVLKDLPKKSERIEWCEMTPLQKTIYNDALQRSRKTVFDLDSNATEKDGAETATNGRVKGAKKTKSGARNKDKLYLENSSNVLMDLRKAASHPMLFRRRFTDEALGAITKLLLKEPDYKKRGAIFEYVKEDMEVMTDAELQLFCASYKSTRRFLQEDDCYLQAGKVQVLLELLKNYRAANRRVLIFSQFTQILDILQKVLQKQEIKFLVLTGSTPVDVRQALVDEFTTDESIDVFLLSTKAGGMGINLTAASVVIMFDQDFNPHNDKQAQDRAYRIGQKQDVDVVKLITKGSIEEDMLSLGQTKLALDEAVAGEEGEERVETEMKTSLLNVVRKKLEEARPEEAAVTAAESMDIDMGSPLSLLEDS